MNRVLTTGMGLLMFLVCTAAMADQCQLVTKAQAADAAKLIRVDDTVFAFCGPCGDKKPNPIKVTAVGITGSQTSWELQINGKSVDLAYTYVKTSSARATNLGGMVGCPTTDVPPFVTVK